MIGDRFTKRKLRKQLEGCNYEMVATLLINKFSGGVIPKELAGLLDAFTANPCFDTAIALIKFDPNFIASFELARHGGFTEHLFRQEHIIMSDHSEFPEIDRSNFTPKLSKKHIDDQLDLSWGEGYFRDGRPFRIECWSANQITYLTYYISTIGLENARDENLKNLLVSEGLIVFDDEKFLSSGFSGCNVSATKKVDASDNQIWEITIIVGDEDGTYIKDHFPLKRYKVDS